MKLGEHSRGGGQNSISTILLIVSFMWVEFKYMFSAMFWPTAEPSNLFFLLVIWPQLCPVLSIVCHPTHYRLHRTELILWKGLYNLKQVFLNISIYIRTTLWWFCVQNRLTVPVLPAYLSFFPFPFCHTLVIRICIRFVWQIWFIPLAEWVSIWMWENPPPIFFFFFFLIPL